MTIVGGSVLRTASQLWKRIHQPAAIPAALRQMSTSETIHDKKLDGKIAIITGGSNGLGAVTAKLFAAHGAQVILADIGDANGKNVCSEIGSNAHYRYCDVTTEKDVASTVDFAVKEFGKLDIMMNNAGVPTPIETFQSLDVEGYDRYTSIMVRGVVLGIKHASRVMVPLNQGVILNTASVASVMTGSSVPLVYNINKSNLPGLTKIAAYHLGKYGIRVNSISPHAVYTLMMGEYLKKFVPPKLVDEEAELAFFKRSSLQGKRCKEDDFAKGALFMCSDESGYVSGQNLIIDGGWSNSKEYDVVGDLLSMVTDEEIAV